MHKEQKSIIRQLIEKLMFGLAGRRLVWSCYMRIFTDGGFPKFRWLPRFRRLHYAPYWGMYGFALYLFGREFNFSFGQDENNLFKKDGVIGNE